MPTAHEPTLHIAICRLSSLGDVALSTACLDLLAQVEQPLQVYWVGMLPHSTLLSYSPMKIKLIAIDPQAKWRSILAAASALQHVHLCVDLQKKFTHASVDYALVLALEHTLL